MLAEQEVMTEEKVAESLEQRVANFNDLLRQNNSRIDAMMRTFTSIVHDRRRLLEKEGKEISTHISFLVSRKLKSTGDIRMDRSELATAAETMLEGFDLLPMLRYKTQLSDSQNELMGLIERDVGYS